MPQPHLTRRGLALAALATTGAAAGCTPGPTVTPRGGLTTPSADQTPDALSVAAREAERALVMALVAASGPSPKRTAADAARLQSLREAHAAHLVVLERADPLDPGSPISGAGHASPAADPSDWKTLAPRIAALETLALASHRAAAMAAKDPAHALLFASLTAFAALNNPPGRPVVDDKTSPAEVEVGTRDDALGVLLSRLRALAEGLEIGLGQVPSTDDLVEPMRKHLSQVWAARDRVVAQLRAAQQPVPPAELGYLMPGGFGSVTEARKTWALLEDDVTAAWARLAAASTGAERGRALDAMLAQARTALGLGAPLTRWPGWV